MNILSISNLAKIGREEPLFTGVTFGLNEGEKAALIGRNGTGKSTLLNTIAGVLVPDEGQVVINKDAGVSFLPQNPPFSKDDTIREHIFKSTSPKLSVIRQYLDLCEKLSTSYSPGIQKQYDTLIEQMDRQDLWNYEAQVSSVLSTLNIHDMERKMGTLSGGMVKKVALAQVLVEDTRLLLLDEPTNHLDITTISWLQNYLRDTDRTVLMVTHDRYFLDAVCTNIFEIDRKAVKLYQGNYSAYLEKKEIETEIQQNTDRRIESVLRFERDWLMRGPCARGTKAKARIQRDMQLINREKFKETKGFTFEVQGRRLGGKVLELESISKSFNGVPVIRSFSYVFTAGQKIGIFGNNGSGKSTFLNIITGVIQSDSGSVVKGENTVFGYYNQNPVFDDMTVTVLEYIKEAAEYITRNDGKTLSASLFLNEFGFEGKIQYSPVSSLSGGERKRLFLVRLLMANPNFLILDEPTNDFDIFTMNILEQFLAQYKGCLLVVSHDRYFMDKTADTLFIIEENGDISGFVGKCSEYISYREQLAAEEKAAAKNAGSASSAGSVEKRAAGTNSGTLSPAENENARQASRQEKRRLTFKEQKEFEGLESEIAALEKQKNELEARMSGGDHGDFSAIGETARKYNECTALLEEKYARWEELAAFV